jgi:hypothetical protein
MYPSETIVYPWTVVGHVEVINFYGRHHSFVDRYGIYVSHMTTYVYHLLQTLHGPLLMHDLLPCF